MSDQNDRQPDRTGYVLDTDLDTMARNCVRRRYSGLLIGIALIGCFLGYHKKFNLLGRNAAEVQADLIQWVFLYSGLLICLLSIIALMLKPVRRCPQCHAALRSERRGRRRWLTCDACQIAARGSFAPIELFAPRKMTFGVDS